MHNGSARYRVGRFEVDISRNSLVCDGQSFPLEPLVMDVLALLLERAGMVVTRAELLDSIWGGRSGGDESLTRAVALLRRVFAKDDAASYIRTIWKKGYVLSAPVDGPVNGPVDGPAVVAATAAKEARGTDDYAVAVLPIENSGSDPSDGFLADGLTRDLNMLFCHVPRLRVAAHSSVRFAAERAADLRETANRLGVRYVVTGSLSRSGPNFQLRAALMDAQDDAQIWGQRIDAPLDGFYRVQDRIVLDISTSIASALQISHVASIRGRRPFQLSAYELVQRAEAMRLAYNRSTAKEIVDLLDRALAMDPDDATVHAALAVQHTQNVVSSFVSSGAESFAIAQRHVDTALALAPDDSEALAAAGVAATMQGDAERAVHFLRRAADLNPNDPHTLAVLGWQECWLDGTRDGIEKIETAEARAPHHPRFSVWAHYRGHCEIRLANLDAAIAAYTDGATRNPGYGLNLATFAAALAQAGRAAQCTRVLTRLRDVSPAYRPADLDKLARRMRFWFPDVAAREAYVAAFESAFARHRG